MIDRENDQPDEGRPPELERLHRELSSIHIEERASFGPELRAELERAWAKGVESDPPEDRRPARRLAAAALVGFLLIGVAVPQARAGLAVLVESVRSEVETILGPPEEPELPAVTMDRPVLDLPEDEASDPSVSRPAARPAARGGEARPGDVRLGVSTFPDILDRARARTVIEEFYPDSLQDRRIGGTVGLLIRVTPVGEVGQVRLHRSSGIPELDRAALDGVRDLRFRPAVRAGEPVSTWVRFDVDFQPPVVEEEPTPTRPPLF